MGSYREHRLRWAAMHAMAEERGKDKVPTSTRRNTTAPPRHVVWLRASRVGG